MFYLPLDAGYGEDPNKPGTYYGNVHPDVFALGGNVQITAFRGAIGPRTTSIIIDRVITLAEERTRKEHPSKLFSSLLSGASKARRAVTVFNR